MTAWIAFLFLVCLSPAVLVAVLVGKEIRQRRRLTHWPRAAAEITGTWRTSSGARPHAVAYTFRVDDTEQQGQASGLHTEPAGPTLEVVYNPDDPTDSRPALTESIGTLIFASVALVGFSAFLLTQLIRGINGG